MSSTIKGPSNAETTYDGSTLRIAIIHARWNKTVIDALVAGTVAKLKASGVKEQNIVIQSVPGSFELPFAVSKYVLYMSQYHSGFNKNCVSIPGSSLDLMFKQELQLQISWVVSALELLHRLSLPRNPLQGLVLQHLL